MRLIDADALLRDIEKYHLSDGMFQHWVEVQTTIEAVPVEFIEKRIAELDKAINYEFNELAEYNGWALNAQSALELLLQTWKEERRENAAD